jgi:hypothetical protein
MCEALVTRATRIAVRAFFKRALRPAVPIFMRRSWADIATRAWSVPKTLRFEPIRLGGVLTERVTSAGSTSMAK